MIFNSSADQLLNIFMQDQARTGHHIRKDTQAIEIEY